MADIKHLIRINSAADKIYFALTEQVGLKGWWTRDTTAKPETGFVNGFKFGRKYHNKMKIVTLEKDKKVEWECILGHEEWIGTKFLFELENKQDFTVLKFSHGNWKSATDFFVNGNTIWGYYKYSLKDFCETGKGTPFQAKQQLASDA